MLKNETMDNIINHTDVNESFNLFLNTFLYITESCSPMQYVTNNVSNYHWITAGIKVSCNCKKYLYIMNKTINCNNIKLHYIQYWRVLQNIVRKAKEMYYKELLLHLEINLKCRGTLLIMKLVLHPSKKFTQTEFKLGIKNVSTNQSAKIFNNYFINTVDELIIQQTNIESAMFSLRELFPYEFP